MSRGVQQATQLYSEASLWGPRQPKQGSSSTVPVCGLQQGPGGGHKGSHQCGGSKVQSPNGPRYVMVQAASY